MENGNPGNAGVVKARGGLYEQEPGSEEASGSVAPAPQGITGAQTDGKMDAGSSSTTGDDAGRKTPSVYISTLVSILMTFFILFPLGFLNLILHEGGHALADLAQGATITSITHLYVHPFAFAGYVRPIQFWYNPWGHASGHAVAILASLLIFILIWRRRSVSNLPLVMLFPFIAFTAGIEAFENIQLRTGDYYNILYLTGLPPTVFYALGTVLFVSGVFFFVSLFPLLGLAPGDVRSLIVVPAALFTWRALSTIVANRFVPGSSIDIQYNLGGEILRGANSSPISYVVIGVFLAVTYIVLYRGAYRRLPTGLRTEKASITRGDLLNHALLFAVSVILGLYIIL